MHTIFMCIYFFVKLVTSVSKDACAVFTSCFMHIYRPTSNRSYLPRNLNASLNLASVVSKRNASSLKCELCPQARNDSLSSMMESLRDDLDKERKQLEEELEEVLEEVTVLQEQDKLLQETLHLLTQDNLTMGEELKSARAELER